MLLRCVIPLQLPLSPSLPQLFSPPQFPPRVCACACVSVCRAARRTQVDPEAAAAGVSDSQARCVAVQPFLEMIDAQESIMLDPSTIQLDANADTAVTTFARPRPT